MKKIWENGGGKLTAGFHQSYWTDTIHALRFTPLDRNAKADVVVIGGGLAGVSVAYCLSKRGKQVVLLEDGFIGSGETGRTTAHLVTALDDRYYNLERIHGEKGARLAAKSHGGAIDFIERVVKEEHIDCEFERVNGYLFLHPTDEPESLDKELDSAQRAGIKVEKLSSIPGMTGYKNGCLKFHNQAQFHPLKYMSGLCKEIIRNGGKIFTETHADKIENNSVTTSNGFTVTADHIVIATNSPLNSRILMSLKQYAYRTYVVGFKIKKGTLPKALWWDTGDHQVNSNIPPYRYIRTVPCDEEYDVLLSGGEDHATGLADIEEFPEEERYKEIETWTRANFPVEETVYCWSGQVMEPMDSLAFIGRDPSDKENVFIVTGDSGNGMTHATIAGTLISDLIEGKENEFEKLYDPSRFKAVKAGKVFFTEVVEGTINYIKNNPKDEDVLKVKSLKKGDGINVRINKGHYGAYRDVKGKLHFVSTVCTHMQCTLKWNKDEKSWDCPCHGSRFTYLGKVINGPANIDLEYHTEDEIELSESKFK